MVADSERRFIAGVRGGTRAARDLLYRRFHRKVLAYLSAFALDPESAWDLTHDVFEKAFQASTDFNGETAALLPWLFVIARNTALDHLRARRRVMAEEPHLVERRCERAAGEARPAWGDDEDVHHAIAGLPDQQRDVLIQHYANDRDPAEIARRLGKSPDAVRHIEQRALTTIRGRLTDL